MKIIKNKNLSHVIGGFQFSDSYLDDTKHILFQFSRYKFVSKMFDGYQNVLEVGASDGFYSQVVFKAVKNLTLTDIDVRGKNAYDFIDGKKKFILNDITKKSIPGKYDGIYMLDVLEHINPGKDENKALKNICKSLKKDGSLIVGMPSLESQKYASKKTIKSGHVNCKTKKNLKLFLENYFQNVFMFSMNDEVLHTGYDQMSQYVIGLCTSKK